MTWILSNSSREVVESTHDKLQMISHVALCLCPIDFGYPKSGGKRSPREQNILYKTGKSRCDGYGKLSPHQYGTALDFYAYVDDKASWDHHHLAVVGAAHLQAASELSIRLEWGGLWRGFPDYPHIQLHRSEW